MEAPLGLSPVIPATEHRPPRALATTLLLLGMAAVIATAGCDSNGGDVRPWQAEDHDRPSGNGRQVSGSVAPGEEEATLIAVTWRQNCARCHGMSGRGDGPEGRMLRTPDLSRPDFHDRYSDEEIASVIKKGRNKMPAFETLPDKVVAGLVRHIRLLGGR